MAAGAKQDIRVADRSGMDADADLTGARLRLRKIQDLQHLGAAKAKKAHSSHSCQTTQAPA